MTQHTRDFIKEGRITVDPECKRLISCLKNGIWDKHQKRFAETKEFGHYDGLAALNYMTRVLNQNRNPIPANLDYDYSNSARPPKKKRSGWNFAPDLKRVLGRQ